MRTDLFDYELPEGLVAARPAERRDESRLLRLSRVSGAVDHHRFRDLPNLLRPGDLLVVNNSKVFPARLYGRREPGGGRIEVLLLKRRAATEWLAMVRPGRKIREGDRLVFGDALRAEVAAYGGKGERLLRFDCPAGQMDEWIERLGAAPLPPYILKERQRLAGEAAGGGAPLETPEDRERYQTVYARETGSVAAPTAGLHFTDALMNELASRGHEIAEVTLHVGPGTFKPVTTTTVEEHPMHREDFEVTAPAAGAINAAKFEGRRVVAVGTTVVRVLESVAREKGQLRAGAGSTDLMIAPGFPFRIVDAMVTNFHLPRSTLLMLVSAFAGRALTLRAYREAIEREYRFYSYGDAMLID